MMSCETTNTDERDVPLLPDDELLQLTEGGESSDDSQQQVQDVKHQHKLHCERRDTFIQSVGCQT